jgi:NADH-quinone oxidoreductase subunit N
MSSVLDLRPAIPVAIVTLAGLVVLLAQAFTPKGKGAPSAALSLAGLVGALVAVVLLASGPGRGSVMAGMLAADDFSLFFHALILGIGILAVLLAPSHLREIGAERGEYYALLLFSIVGMLGLVSAKDLIAVFITLEIMSVSLYAMAGMRRDREESQEAALKYFVTGAFSSSFLLYGIALLYGASGSTLLQEVGPAVAAIGPGQGKLVIIGVGLLLVGFGFKVALVPFHMWTPDVYEGAPTTATAFMSAGVKAAAFGALLRVFGEALAPLASSWQPLVAALAMVTMVIGNLGALAQTSVKRMLAYSSVAHAGYILVALVAAPQIATEAVLFYLVGYAAVNLGGFGALAALAKAGREPLSLDDVSGLADRHPALAAALTVFLISLTGVPVSAGFVGKFYLFGAAVGAGYTILAVVGVLMSVVSAYYYLRVVVSMYMREPVPGVAWTAPSPAASLALAVSVAVVLALGVYPAPVLEMARRAALSLL